MNSYQIAKQQLTLILRSKWLVSFGLLFLLLAFFVVYFSDTSGSGYVGFNRMTASLLNLTLLMIPLISLLMGSLFIAGEKEDGGLLLLMTYPIHSRSILTGKFFGLLTAIGTVLTAGYGVALLSTFFVSSNTSMTVMFQFYGLSFLLAAIFVSLSIWIGLRSRSRFHALGVSLIVWALTVLFYEFIIMGISVLIPKSGILSLLSISIFLNPVELIRVWGILSLDGASVFGPGLYDFTIWAKEWTGTLLFVFTTLLWIVIPFFFSKRTIKRGIEND